VTSPSRVAVLALALLAAAAIRPGAAAAQENIDICSTQAVPANYVVVATQSRPSCPGYNGMGYNSLTIRLPGDTVSVCSSLSQLSQGWVMTSQLSRPSCPGYNGLGANSVTYRRLATAGPAPVATRGALTLLDEYDRGVYGSLREMEGRLEVGVPTHTPWFASAASGATVRGELQVNAGGRYTLVGVCDRDCADMDLRVLDGTYVVAQDVGTERHATLEITPARTGRLTVEAIIYQCSQNPCHFAVAAYESRSVATVPPRPRTPRPTPRPRPRD